MPVNFRCKRCGNGMWMESDRGSAEVSCGRCARVQHVDADRGLDEQGQLVRCFVCECDKLYRQRDFNRKMGVIVVAIAAVLAPFTRYISLVVAALIDFLLYVSVGEIALCYHCGCIHRGFDFPESIEGYDLATHERYENRDWGHEE